VTAIKKYATSRGETRWRVRYTPDRSYTDKRGLLTKRDALLFANALDTSLGNGTYVFPSAGRVTVGALYETWSADRTRVKSTTVAKSASAWSAHVGPKWAETAVGDLRPSAVRAWVGGLTQAGAGAATIENALGLLRALTDMAVTDQRIPSSPVGGDQAAATQASISRLPEPSAGRCLGKGGPYPDHPKARWINGHC